ncbi:MAG TPA: hypothetical protein VLB84_09720 [Bacteroidia bacterium]|nr:hypothetical protein [Bacteroidia bacterium]
MDYITQLMKEHSRSNTELIAGHIGKDVKRFKEIIDIIYKEKEPLPHRASWLLAVVNDRYPELLKPYISLFVESIEQFKTDGIKRNISNVLSKQEIPEAVQGKAVDIFFRLLLSPTETVAVKTFSLQILANITSHYPELKQELILAIEDQLPKTTAAFHSRSRHILKRL